MTHFNHDWDTTQTPAIPVAIGDRYYAQDLNDDFNYLKHLPYETILCGRTRGVMVAPNDTWDNNNTLTLSGGFGVVALNTICLDPNENFTIPPKTEISSRYERIPFTDTTLILPNDGNAHYIVATPTKRSLLQRTKALLTEQYASRVRYDGVITIQDTAPTADQILIGMCGDKEYYLCIDNNPNQAKDYIELKKWISQDGTLSRTTNLITYLNTYYNRSGEITIKTTWNLYRFANPAQSSHRRFNLVDSIIYLETVDNDDTPAENPNVILFNGNLENCIIEIAEITNNSANGGVFVLGSGWYHNCTIEIGSKDSNITLTASDSKCHNCEFKVSSTTGETYFRGVYENTTIEISSAYGNIECGTFNNCNINIGSSNGNNGISGETFNNCNVNISRIQNGGINSGTFNNCNINIGDITKGFGVLATFNNCNINIGDIGGQSFDAFGISGGATLNNCKVHIRSVRTRGEGVRSGTFNHCGIIIDEITSGAIDGISNSNLVNFYLVHIVCSAITDLSSTNGKLNVLNDTVFHAS